MANTKQSKASQEIVSIKEIRDGVVILKDNSYRMVLMTSSLNFALKSSEEQSAIIMQYQNFLNSLDFYVQFFVQSCELNIEDYLDTLRQSLQEQTDELLKIQTKEYIEFIREFVTSTKIVSKSFYVIVPYSTTILTTNDSNPIKNLFGGFLKKEKEVKVTPQEEFEKIKLQIQQRADTVVQGLSRVGVRCAPLNTEELIELFYKIYNPGEIEKPKIPQDSMQQMNNQ